MSISTCPTDVIAASPDRIWRLLTQPAELAAWSGSKLLEGPERTLMEDDRVVLSAGFGLRVTLLIRSIEPPRQLRTDVYLPFGVVNREVIQISPIDVGRCRVTLN